MLELLTVIALGALLVMGVTLLSDDTMADTRRQHTAAHQAEITAAAGRYLRDHQRELVAQMASAPTPLILTFGTMQAQGYIPFGMADTNAYQQKSCVLLTAVADQIDALVITVDGQEITPGDIAHIAAMAGPGGGYLDGPANAPANAPATSAIGAEGTWRLDPANMARFAGANCAGHIPQRGHLASALFSNETGPGNTSKDYFARNPAADPSLNQLQTALGMRGAAIVAEGGDCGDGARLAVNTDRDIVSCNNGKWERMSTWKDPVANFDALAALATAPNKSPPMKGDVRLALDTPPRAYTFNGATWQGVVFDQAGNLQMEGNLKAATGTLSNNMNASDVDVTGNLMVKHVKEKPFSGTVSTAGLETTTWTDSHVYGFGNSLGNQIVAAGDPCELNASNARRTASTRGEAPNGLIGKDINGITLFCYKPDNVYRYHNGTFRP
ncbi:MAG: shufflon system plasmid conjugative transfer pilus tip adhesin PilV [Pseudomonadota bacterium]